MKFKIILLIIICCLTFQGCSNNKEPISLQNDNVNVEVILDFSIGYDPLSGHRALWQDNSLIDLSTETEPFKLDPNIGVGAINMFYINPTGNLDKVNELRRANEWGQINHYYCFDGLEIYQIYNVGSEANMLLMFKDGNLKTVEQPGGGDIWSFQQVDGKIYCFSFYYGKDQESVKTAQPLEITVIDPETLEVSFIHGNYYDSAFLSGLEPELKKVFAELTSYGSTRYPAFITSDGRLITTGVYTSQSVDDLSYYDTPLMFIIDVNTGQPIEIKKLDMDPVAMAQTEDGFVFLVQTGHEILLEDGSAVFITDRMELRYLDNNLNIKEVREIDEEALSLSYRYGEPSVYKDGKFYISGSGGNATYRFLTIDVNTGKVKMLDDEVKVLVNTIRLTKLKDGLVCNVNGYNVKP